MNKPHGLDAYCDWAHRKADRMRETLMIALLAVALVGCAAEVPEPKPELPIAAFGFNQCGGAVVLIVIVDGTHVLRFDQKQTTIFVRNSDGTVSEQHGPPTPFPQAFALAQSAAITSNATVPCGRPEVTT